MRRLIFVSLIALVTLTACVRFNISTPVPVQTEFQPTLHNSDVTATAIYPWTDENSVMSGICFEAALDAAEKVFVLHDANEHSRFYDQADNSHLCRHPVTRNPFDFSDGRILAGLWSTGHGCKARHDVTGILRDDTARTFTITLNFVVEGDCNYELVRPFWIGLDGVGNYTIQIIVNSAG
jgi:hypothetical protein